MSAHRRARAAPWTRIQPPRSPQDGTGRTNRVMIGAPSPPSATSARMEDLMRLPRCSRQHVGSAVCVCDGSWSWHRGRRPGVTTATDDPARTYVPGRPRALAAESPSPCARAATLAALRGVMCRPMREQLSRSSVLPAPPNFAFHRLPLPPLSNRSAATASLALMVTRGRGSARRGLGPLMMRMRATGDRAAAI